MWYHEFPAITYHMSPRWAKSVPNFRMGFIFEIISDAHCNKIIMGSAPFLTEKVPLNSDQWPTMYPVSFLVKKA
jgi:hypothetical protein